MTKPANKPSDLSADDVRDYLKQHPDFLKNNLDMVAELTPPEQKLENGIIDFQHYLVKNLQKDSKALKSRYDVLIDFCRDNMAVQQQVHQAVLRLIRARSIEQLLEVVTIDLVSLFDVDVVRLAMESEAAQLYGVNYGEENYSGIVLIETGMVDMALGKKKNVRLEEDCSKKAPPGFDQIFADCNDLIESCALLRLELNQVGRNVILAFGVRHKDRFHSGQGIEFLSFLAQIVAHQLDIYLQDLSI
jgi:uncharacterized protein YigA (DUF484 family)